MNNLNYAICNETFEGWDHAKICGEIAEWGYTGLEIAPFTLAPLITDVSGKKRIELGRIAEDAGIEILGLHWLLAKTEGFQLTSPDAAVRVATAEYLVDLAYACADLGGSVLVLGSPLQRNIPEGHTLAQATEFAADTISKVLQGLDDTKVTLALEPLGPQETNFWNTTAEVAAMMKRLDHPFVKMQLDVKALSTEATPVADLIRQYAKETAHFHANDANRQGPGFGDVDFVPVLRALMDNKYKGYVSVEVFDYTPDPTTIATKSIEYMKKCESEARALKA